MYAIQHPVIVIPATCKLYNVRHQWQHCKGNIGSTYLDVFASRVPFFSHMYERASDGSDTSAASQLHGGVCVFVCACVCVCVCVCVCMSGH